MRFVFGFLFLFLSTAAFSQDFSFLLGKWSIEYAESEDHSIYEFKMEEHKLIGRCISYVDESGDKDPMLKKRIVDIAVEGEYGSGFYVGEYDGEKFEVKFEFRIISKEQIKTKYKYFSYEGEEIWKKMREVSSR